MIALPQPRSCTSVPENPLKYLTLGTKPLGVLHLQRCQMKKQNPRYPYPAEVSSTDAIRMVAWANEIARDEWAPEFGKETTVFWFKDEKHPEALMTAYYLRQELSASKRE
ncbi:hypothetical protein [Bradyrhizobium sp. SZCCHNR2028]|uniref:hypothetical protein n=1 Tax=Bradyrhizobium sp. SZCCHNR2028 TaxID=3057382 RepID=UPI0028EDFE0C|nr:hypothetical protein [Bradyrhizobium sp. SZCCHNR2028]